ncbi:MAG TPA: TolC family protein [Pirellulaceae bacterium]|nr:TolC family protein [Pirellulaceae bacterium]HMO92045.1 TolC family protein [Pirellulaceae bacterium]HMP68844.1 TolC family protein [Pirellulaceae bacterium]
MLSKHQPFVQLTVLMCIALIIAAIGNSIGCRTSAPARFPTGTAPCQTHYQQIEIPRLQYAACEDTSDILTGPPPTISNFESLDPLPMSLEEAIVLTLQNSKVLQKLGGRVIAGPQGTSSIYDPALQATNPQQSIEAALSAFDAQVASNITWVHSERKINQVFPPGFGVFNPINDQVNFTYGVSKTAATGSTFGVRSITDYSKTNFPSRFPSVYETTLQIEARQPLLRGFGSTVNRIAGPNAQPGFYNGVMIARIRNDIAVADFEIAIRDLVRDVEQTYWELYFAYRDLDAKKRAREVARSTWEKRKALFDGGEGRPDEEALARQQYFQFETQVQNALAGQINGLPGLLGAERNLRRLVGLPNHDGRIIQPSSEPALAPIRYDWDQAQFNAMDRRVELRRQKWNVKQRELELIAAKQLNKWRLDLVGQYGWKGFGDNLFGSSGRPEGSAVNDFFQGDLDDWSLGLELQGPIGNRTGHLAVRNAHLALAREQALLREQQRQILHDLNAAYTEVDRAYLTIATNFNTFQAVIDELTPKRLRAEIGDEDFFFLLNAQQIAAQTETAFHRAVVDYNLALLNFNFQSGELLSSFGINLLEGEWSEAAQIDMIENANQFLEIDRSRRSMDLPAVTRGAFDQGLN